MSIDCRWARDCGFALLALLTAAGAAGAQTAGQSALTTNQAYVERALGQTALDPKQPLSVFGFVLDNLPDRVKVYPTENYYYFRFVHDGAPYGGDIRLDPRDRDQGRVHFGYYEQLTPWDYEHDAVGFDEILGPAQGVTVERTAPLHYRISYKQKQVEFELNDLSQVKPPPTAIGPDETFIGPIFDESAIRFFLVYNARLKIFLYLLDETVKTADQLVATKHSDRILIGKRTGFAFYRDLRRDRKILIGVFALNSDINNYLDGPFDQLPDNFITGNTLHDAEVASDPSVKGQIDRLGHYLDGSGRFLIQPFTLYRKESDLYGIDRCARRRAHASDYERCFVTDMGPQGVPRGRR